ncbi:MAG: 2-oxoglutarate dehydrogenase complex dihydrolipoyllysine-residue succinyltransferase [Planctomycetales bacterium]|nr:2-oxoglutarate dehydrogenase complex dihydrolipoyllysine-residue succinyltransferase [Planctomycetales bacterium]
MIEVKVPSVGESISEVQIGQWLKREGEWVAQDENLVELETEKASVQVPAPVAGYLRKITKQLEEFAAVGDTLCELEPAAAPQTDVKPAPPPAAIGSSDASSPRIMPAAKRILEEQNISPDKVTATGPGGRILKEDAQLAVAQRADTTPTVSQPASQSLETEIATKADSTSGTLTKSVGNSRVEEVKPLSMIRRTIAARLVQAQQTAALLTTFNEVNMQPIMELRKKYRDAFQERHGVKLGFMSFFAKASVEALRRFPSVNAEIRGNNIVYRHFQDIGIAIGGGKGLVVPVLRNVELMSFAEVERTIGDFAGKAMQNRLMPEDLEGGTFTISNGGVYGSLLSTPIVNPPQSAILGLHAIQDRPMAVDGQVVILPMMNLALTYDHRIIDGREAVSFLKTVKEICEDPTRLFLEV